MQYFLIQIYSLYKTYTAYKSMQKITNFMFMDLTRPHFLES